MEKRNGQPLERNPGWVGPRLDAGRVVCALAEVRGEGNDGGHVACQHWVERDGCRGRRGHQRFRTTHDGTMGWTWREGNGP